MLEVNILRKVLDYSFIENIVYIPEVECLKDENKTMFYHLNGFRLCFWDTNYTYVLKCERFYFSFLFTIVLS